MTIAIFAVLLIAFVGIAAKIAFDWKDPFNDVCVLAIWPIGFGLLFVRFYWVASLG